MTVPALEKITPVVNELMGGDKHSPYASTWWTTVTVRMVPAESYQWMLANGWRVVSVDYDRSTTPPTPYYTMTRQAMQNWMVMQNVLNGLMTAYNEGRYNNARRYWDIVRMLGQSLTKSQTSLDAIGDTSDGHVSVYLSDLASIASEVQLKLTPAFTWASGLLTSANNAANAIYSSLSKFETYYQAHAATIATNVSAVSSSRTTFLSDFSAQLTLLQSEFTTHLAAVRVIEAAAQSDLTAHIVAYQAALANLANDFSTHNTTSTAYLTGLGATELARINEQFDNLLAQTNQALIDRGLGSAADVAEIRIERERSEQITALNDRLARERAENEHKLYEQQQVMRVRTMEALDRVQQLRQALSQWLNENESRLESERLAVRSKILEGIDRERGAGDDSIRLQSELGDRLLAQAQESVQRAAQGNQMAGALQLQAGEFHTNAIIRLCAAQAEAKWKKAQGRMDVRGVEEQLMRYQVDTQNNLVVGLSGIIERRTDSYPDLTEVFKFASTLGDAGSTQWVTP
jgi:hypothetical protein